MTYGQDATFTTPAPPAPAAPDAVQHPAAPVVPPTAGEHVKPVIAKTLVADDVKGIVKLKVPGSQQWAAVTDDQSIPMGAVLDTSNGRLTFETALLGGVTQTAQVWGGRLYMRQNQHGMVDLYLAGPALSCARAAGMASMAKATKGGKKKLIWVKDSHGRFRSHGKNSVATVRGTQWLTHETCAGTLTRVKQGKVAVRDVHTHKTVLVRAGHGYLAKRG
jgi:hypothetical protein